MIINNVNKKSFVQESALDNKSDINKIEEEKKPEIELTNIGEENDEDFSKLIENTKNMDLGIKIETKPILKANFSAVKQLHNTKKYQQSIKKNIKPLIYPNITIMDNLKKKSTCQKFYIANKRNTSLIVNKEKNKYFDKIKIYKGNPIEVDNNKFLHFILFFFIVII